MKESWQQWSVKFSAMAQREKLMILIVGLFVLGYLSIWFVLSPLQASYSNNKTRIINLTRQESNTHQQLAMINDALMRDYTADLIVQEKAIDEQATLINHNLAKFSLSYISPENMASVLQKLLRKHKELTLSQFKINPVKPIYVQVNPANDGLAEEQAEKQKIAFYQHTMQVQIEGSYFSLLSYLKQIKQIEEKIFIQEFDYRVDEYPMGKLTLTIATVSANDKFIAL
ncbi:hypothetical protein [Pseudoalteromonas sp.]|uniref:hypothetical protein n=1 Tax=Pseudoalteromonas sp. TaxID=53249 RepID=UPI003567231D